MCTVICSRRRDTLDIRACNGIVGAGRRCWREDQMQNQSITGINLCPVSNRKAERRSWDTDYILSEQVFKRLIGSNERMAPVDESLV